MVALNVMKFVRKPAFGLMSISVVALVAPVAFLLLAFHFQGAAPKTIEIFSDVLGGIVAMTGVVIKILFFMFK